ncbi:mCG145635, partial [Mus musculus]
NYPPQLKEFTGNIIPSKSWKSWKQWGDCGQRHGPFDRVVENGAERRLPRGWEGYKESKVEKDVIDDTPGPNAPLSSLHSGQGWVWLSPPAPSVRD